MTKSSVSIAWFTRGDLDGFFGLFVDNLLQLMLMGILCKLFCGFPTEFITRQILPGATLSILIGNLYYAWQIRQLAISSGREDVTALPFGINTPSLITFIFLIMAPVYQETKDYHLAWQAGLFACFLNGVMEIIGAYGGDWLRKNTDRHRERILEIFSGVYGPEQAFGRWSYWRVFFMACAELWGYNRGQEWIVSHYLFEKSRE